MIRNQTPTTQAEMIASSLIAFCNLSATLTMEFVISSLATLPGELRKDSVAEEFVMLLAAPREKTSGRNSGKVTCALSDTQVRPFSKEAILRPMRQLKTPRMGW